MKINYQMKVSDKELYEFLVESFRVEINHFLEKSVEIKEGISFEKKLLTTTKKARKVKVILSKLEQNKLYETKYIAGPDTTVVKYIINKIDENSIDVIYEDVCTSTNTKIEFNYKIFSFILGYFSKRKMKKKFKKVEKYIISCREV